MARTGFSVSHICALLFKISIRKPLLISLMLLKIRSVQLTGSVEKDVAKADDLRSVSTSHSRRGDLNFYKLFSVVHTHTVQMYMHT